MAERRTIPMVALVVALALFVVLAPVVPLGYVMAPPYCPPNFVCPYVPPKYWVPWQFYGSVTYAIFAHGARMLHHQGHIIYTVI